MAGANFALAAPSKRHNRICVNIAMRLRNAARGGDCRVYMGDVELQVRDDVFYYPDVMVACRAEEPGAYVQEAPCVVVEVCAPATASPPSRNRARLPLDL